MKYINNAEFVKSTLKNMVLNATPWVTDDHSARLMQTLYKTWKDNFESEFHKLVQTRFLDPGRDKFNETIMKKLRSFIDIVDMAVEDFIESPGKEKLSWLTQAVKAFSMFIETRDVTKPNSLSPDEKLSINTNNENFLKELKDIDYDYDPEDYDEE